MQSNCETCMYFGYDEEFEEYFCEVNLDEDEMEKISHGQLSRRLSLLPFGG